jgi:hypothetical protein
MHTCSIFPGHGNHYQKLCTLALDGFIGDLPRATLPSFHNRAQHANHTSRICLGGFLCKFIHVVEQFSGAKALTAGSVCAARLKFIQKMARRGRVSLIQLQVDTTYSFVQIDALRLRLCLCVPLRVSLSQANTSDLLFPVNATRVLL